MSRRSRRRKRKRKQRLRSQHQRRKKPTQKAAQKPQPKVAQNPQPKVAQNPQPQPPTTSDPSPSWPLPEEVFPRSLPQLKDIPVDFMTSIPVHDDRSEDHEASCDWPDATYETEVNVRDESCWEVIHTLAGVPGVEELLKSGQARFAVELCCAPSMYSCSKTATSVSELTTRIEVPLSQIRNAKVYLWPGVATVEDCELNTAGSAWGNGRTPVAKGCWLVRGAPHIVYAHGEPLLIFQEDPDMSPPSSAAISSEHLGGDIQFVVRAHPDRIAQLHKRGSPQLLACYSTALAMIKDCEEFKMDGDRVPGSPLGDTLARYLQDKKVPVWEEHGWDPMRAAAVFVPLQPTPDEEGADV